jgi:hypothetical protein
MFVTDQQTTGTVAPFYLFCYRLGHFFHFYTENKRRRTRHNNSTMMVTISHQRQASADFLYDAISDVYFLGHKVADPCMRSIKT